MKIQDKIRYLNADHYEEWSKTWRETECEMSFRQLIICVCGRMATGLHESSCRKFQSKVNAETVKKLKHLLPIKHLKKHEQ